MPWIWITRCQVPALPPLHCKHSPLMSPPPNRSKNPGRREQRGWRKRREIGPSPQMSPPPNRPKNLGRQKQSGWRKRRMIGPSPQMSLPPNRPSVGWEAHTRLCNPTIPVSRKNGDPIKMLTEVCHNVATEPRLQPLSGETLTQRTAISTDDARLDIRARGFWCAAQDAYFDVRVFYPNAPSNSAGTISAAYVKHENIKKRAYGERVRNIEHGVFTPLVFSSTGGMGKESTAFYKRLADMLAYKKQLPYSVTMSWLRCKLSFAALRSSIMCIRGTRSSQKQQPIRDADITLATSEGCIPQC